MLTMTKVLIEEITEKQYIQIKFYHFRKIIINILVNSFLYKYTYLYAQTHGHSNTTHRGKVFNIF